MLPLYLRFDYTKLFPEIIFTPSGHDIYFGVSKWQDVNFVEDQKYFLLGILVLYRVSIFILDVHYTVHVFLPNNKGILHD